MARLGRLGQFDALRLMDAIELGTATYNLDAEFLITGTDRWFEPARAPVPTDATPGSAAKIEVLRQRVESGESLWHPRDSNVLPQLIEPVADAITSIWELAVA